LGNRARGQKAISAIRIRAADGGATSLADALRYKGNLRWDDSLVHLSRAGKISAAVFKASAMA
jgi:twitching motility protein PilT